MKDDLAFAAVIFAVFAGLLGVLAIYRLDAGSAAFASVAAAQPVALVHPANVCNAGADLAHASAPAHEAIAHAAVAAPVRSNQPAQ